MAEGWLGRLVGRTLTERYRIDRIVGAGGHGTVFAGRHLFLDVPVAIKVLHAASEGNTERRQRLYSRFVNESQLLAQLRHPHIVGILDAGMLEADDEVPAVPWMVIEWCEGESLAAHVARSGPMPLAEAWALLRPVVDAVAYAHKKGVVHRDLKPANIVLAEDGAPRVLDFGIAKVMTEEEAAPEATATATASRSFTPAYAAPEQLAGQRTGPWTDVHALGLLMTQLVTGRPPYGGADAIALHAAAHAEVRPTPRCFGVDVGAWEAVLARALARRAADRHRDAGELLGALDASAPTSFAAEPTATPPPPASDGTVLTDGTMAIGGTLVLPPRRQRARWPWLLAALALASAAVVALYSRLRPVATATPPPAGEVTVSPYARERLLARLKEDGWSIVSENQLNVGPCAAVMYVVLRVGAQLQLTSYDCASEASAVDAVQRHGEHPSTQRGRFALVAEPVYSTPVSHAEGLLVAMQPKPLE
jgi:serine/threonine-protein kinase